MTKAWRLGLIGSLVLLSLMLASPCGAQGGIQVVRNAYDYAFRDHITFNLEASSDTDITEVILAARISGESGRQRDESEFEPGQSVSVEVTWDEMAEDTYRPPGVTVKYWWEIQDAAGNQVKTEPVTFVYMDDRHPWQVLDNEAVALYWYKGDDSLGSALFERAVQALDQISAELGVQVENQVKVFVYGTYDDLRVALGEGSHEWVGGTSFTDYAVIALGVAPDNLDYGLRVVPHELTHAVLAQMMEPPFGKLPHWMEEGLAMHYEGSMTDDESVALQEAVENNSLLSIRSLASNFPQDYDQAILSYAESNSVIEFIFEVYGNKVMAQLLEVFAVGAHQDDGFREVLGFDVDGLEDEWRAYIGAPSREGVTRATLVPMETPETTALTPLPQLTGTPQAAATRREPEDNPPTSKSKSPTGLWCLSPLLGAALLGLFLLFRPRASG